MPRTTKSRKPKVNKPKGKSLFDFISDIYQKDYDPDYWDSLSETEKKAWSTYMIHRFISMNPNFLPMVCEVMTNASDQLTGKEIYAIYSSLIPNGKYFYKYVKASKEYPSELLELVANYYEVSQKEAYEYIEIMIHEQGQESVLEFVVRCGYEEKDAKKLVKSL